MRRTRTLLLLGVGAVTALAPAALAGGVSEYPWRDWENGWSIKTILAWETRPPSLPSTSQDARVVAGWYPKGSEGESWSIVIAFGRYFGDAVQEAGAPGDPAGAPAPAAGAPATPTPPKPAAPADPEKFPKWMEDWLRQLKKTPRSKVTGEITSCRLGPDPGWQYEGEYEFTTRERSSFGDREPYDLDHKWKILAVGGRRGDFEVGTVFFLGYDSWDDPPNLKTVRESARSLRFLDAKDMVRRRDELETKVKKAGGEDEAWIVRVRAKIPAGWRYFRRADTVYVHPDAIPGTTVETMAARLDAMRKKAYAKIFPADVDAEAPPAVVKITRDEQQYLSYGAPKGSLGYFAGGQRELVLFYQAKDWWDRIDSTAVLFHEGFHQYVDQALDGFNAHPWFEEGFGDYFAGWRLFEGSPRPGELVARRVAMDDILEEDAWIAAGDLMRMEWDAFYGRGEDAVHPGIAYAQSWSFVTFLRSGKNSVRIDRYWAALRDGVKKWKDREASAANAEGRPTRAAGEMPAAEAKALRAKALEAGFGDADFGDLEQAWLDALTK